MEKKIRKPTKKEKKEVLPKRYNQRAYNRLFIGVTASFVLLSVGAMATNIIRLNAKGQEVIQTVEPKKTNEANYRLQNWSSNFVYYYFNFSSDYQQQATQVDRLNSFYVEPMDIKAQGHLRVPSELVSSRLMEISETTITYLVSYTVMKESEEKQNVVTEFNIPYGSIDGKFYVSDLPYFTMAKDSQVKELKEGNLRLDMTTDVSDVDKTKLDEFVKLFFTNYTTSQENLDLVSKNVSVLSNSTLKTVDFTAYDKAKNKVTAYVQVTFETAGNTRSENFTLELKEEGTSYKVSNLIHGIR